ncbi:hypothetical protein Emag_007591 [Eimeria magna]
MAALPRAVDAQGGRDDRGNDTSSNSLGVVSAGPPAALIEGSRPDIVAKPAGGEGASSSTAASSTPEAEPEGEQQQEAGNRAVSSHASGDGAGRDSGEVRGEADSSSSATAADTPEPQATSLAHAEEDRGRAGSEADRHSTRGEEEEGEAFFSTGEDVSSSSDSSGSDDSSESSDSNNSSEDEEEEDGEDSEKREEAEETGETEEELVHGCSHYRRKCKVVAPCCGKVFWCRHCHNEESEKDISTAQ